MRNKRKTPAALATIVAIAAMAAGPAAAEKPATPSLAAASQASFRPQALVLVHGIGEQKAGEYDGFMAQVRGVFNKEVQRLTGKAPPSSALIAKAAFWADVTQGDQDRYLEALQARYGKTTFDHLAVGMGGDALSYAGTKATQMKDRVKSAISEAGQKMGSANGDLTVVGHSWGTVVSSDAMWDMTESKRPDAKKLPSNLKWRRFVTMGGPLAIVAQRMGLDNLDSPVKPEEWTNVWYRRDVVGKPLEPLGGTYARMVKDGAINEVRFQASNGYGKLQNLFRKLLGHLRFSGTTAHKHYWTDPRIVNDIAHRLAHQYVGTYGSKAASQAGAKTITAQPRPSLKRPMLIRRDAVRTARH